MSLESFLQEKKNVILERWFQLILKTYPPDTSSFLKKEKDRFINPVGQTFLQEVGALYEGLCRRAGPDELAASLDNIIRIRAVQDFTPSQAVGFVFLLKNAIREELVAAPENPPVAELLNFESLIDGLALLAFDRYVVCRDKIAEIRLNQVRAEKEMLERLLDRPNSARTE